MRTLTQLCVGAALAVSAATMTVPATPANAQPSFGVQFSNSRARSDWCFRNSDRCDRFGGYRRSAFYRQGRGWWWRNRWWRHRAWRNGRWTYW